MKREDILKKAIELINNDRAKDYGPAYENHKRIADLWSVVFGQKVTVFQVVLCLLLLKIARLIYSPTKTDSWIDIGGYTGLGGEFAEKEKHDK
jgi:hypothetical protein|tara:strand:- start:167 stop:445 length:279 start_codon:yes stop_codon:yes gene_type:complete